VATTDDAATSFTSNTSSVPSLFPVNRPSLNQVKAKAMPSLRVHPLSGPAMVTAQIVWIEKAEIQQEINPMRMLAVFKVKSSSFAKKGVIYKFRPSVHM
jgi:hypothetical protein